MGQFIGHSIIDSSADLFRIVKSSYIITVLNGIIHSSICI